MKANEIEVGGVYVAKVSNKLTTVRVDAIREVPGYHSSGIYGSSYSRPAATRYDVTNEKTGRKTTFRSAAKFRRKCELATEVEKLKMRGIMS